jgi:hypothetical protein
MTGSPNSRGGQVHVGIGSIRTELGLREWVQLRQRGKRGSELGGASADRGRARKI